MKLMKSKSLPPNTLTFNLSLIDISSNSTCRMRLSTFTPLFIKILPIQTEDTFILPEVFVWFDSPPLPFFCFFFFCFFLG